MLLQLLEFIVMIYNIFHSFTNKLDNVKIYVLFDVNIYSKMLSTFNFDVIPCHGDCSACNNSFLFNVMELTTPYARYELDGEYLIEL